MLCSPGNDFKEDFLMSLSTLNNIRTIRKEAREISFEIFEEILEKMKKVHEELLADQLEIEEKRAKKLALMEQFREMLAAEGIEGISISEIADGVAAPAAKKGKALKVISVALLSASMLIKMKTVRKFCGLVVVVCRSL
jgi:DNA-binding protein H-NS